MKTVSNLSASDVALLRSSPLFDADWYLEQYPDVKALGLDPAEHFLWIGHVLDRNPSRRFDLSAYREANRDVKSAGVNPLLHYLTHGIRENRPTYPVFDAEGGPERRPCKRRLTSYHETWDTAAHDATIDRLRRLPAPFAEDRVSIIMPTWNRGKVILTAIESALSQTHRNLELIVVDDHSTDDTAERVRRIADPRLKFTVNARAKGVSGARNTGLEIATGDWIFFLDSDNAWDPRLVEFLLKHAADSQSSAGYCAADLQDDAGRSKRILYADFDFESCLRNNFIDLNCFFLRWTGPFRTFRFDEGLRRLVDWDLILRVATRTRVTGLPFVGVSYYDGSSQRITNQEYADRQEIVALQERIREKARPLIEEPARIRDAAACRIAVHLHVYHPERVAECIAHLQRIPVEFDLFVTTSLQASHPVFATLRAAFPQMRLGVYPNVGADIATFLELVSTFKPYELVLKIHTKRDVEPWGDAWRRGLLAPILGSTALVEELIERFRANDRLLLACGADFYKHGRKNSIPSSLAQVSALAGELGLSDHLDKDWAFVAGTMFWIRPRVLLKVARRMCDSEGYSASFRRDGAIEHGLERILGLALWEDPTCRIATVSMAGEVTEVGLGEGFSLEGVSQTMKRLQL
jgi:glycosyltransferase involved in cell wall biosynthesis